VSAKDLGTGKSQEIRVTAASGLSEADISRMIKEAEAHQGEDRKKRELADARNKAEAWSTPPRSPWRSSPAPSRSRTWPRSGPTWRC